MCYSDTPNSLSPSNNTCLHAYANLPYACMAMPINIISPLFISLHAMVVTSNVAMVYRRMHDTHNQHQQWYRRMYPWVFSNYNTILIKIGASISQV